MAGGAELEALAAISEAVSESLAGEFAAHGIKVTIVEPGAFRTKFNAAALDVAANVMPDTYESTTQFLGWLKENDGKQPGGANRQARLVAGYDSVPRWLRAGLDPERPPRTWDELREAARKLTVREGGEVKQWGVTISGGWHDWLFEAFVRQNGGWLISPDWKQVNFTSQEAVGALEFWVDLMHKEKVGPPHSTWASTPSSSARSASSVVASGSAARISCSMTSAVSTASVGTGRIVTRLVDQASSLATTRADFPIGVRARPTMTMGSVFMSVSDL